MTRAIQDAVTALIQDIRNTQSPGGWPGTANSSVLGQTESVLSLGANFAQLLGTAAPTATAAAVAVVEGAGNASATCAEQIAALEEASTASAIAGGYVAGIVLLVSFVLAIVVSSNSSQSTDSEQLTKLNDAINGLRSDILAGYWKSTTGPLQTAWSPVGGALDDLAAEGTSGYNVVCCVNQYHGHARDFVNLFVPEYNFLWYNYWERPFDGGDPSQLIDGQQLGGGNTISDLWYGRLPQPAGTGPDSVLDPSSLLSFLALGISAYLKIQMLVHYVDKNAPTFDTFIQAFHSDIVNYMNFLYEQYSIAVKGIAKTDIPSEKDVLGGLWAMVSTTARYTNQTIETDNEMANLLPYWGGSPPAPDFSHYGSGYAFGGWAGASYGAAETYPAYGVYEPLSTLPDGSYCSPSVFMSWTVWEEDVYGEWQSHQLMFGSGATWYLSVTALWDWVIPWIQNRVIVGTMARWKAIYLLNNYDKVWSIVQKLRELTKSEAVLPPQMILDDGTMATADWSARELCKVLIVKGRFLDGLGQNGLIETSYKSDLFGAPTWTGYSLYKLFLCLDKIGNGNWGGPPDYTSPGQPNIAAPFSLRDRLAAAALR